MSLAEEIIQALEAAFSSPSPEERQLGYAHLQQLKQIRPVEFFVACAQILTSPNYPILGRELAGFQIKNSMNPAYSTEPCIISAILEQGLSSTELRIRKVSSSIVSLAVRDTHWPAPPVVQQLGGALVANSAGSSVSPFIVHGSMLALSKIVDDCVPLLDMHQVTGYVVEAVIPYLRGPLRQEKESLEIRVMALKTIAVVLEQAGTDLQSCSFLCTAPVVLSVIQACFENLENPVSDEVTSVCISCIVFSLIHEEQIANGLFETILQLMIKATTQKEQVEEAVRIAAVQFWSTVLRFPRFAQLSSMQIQQIIPYLIKCMIYSDMEIGMLSMSENDWQVEDKEDEIRPRHYHSKVQSASADEDDNDSDEVEEWNLRRVSALTLDEISSYFGEPILQPTLGIIKDWIGRSASSPEQWKYVEAAVLALGAITEGCLSAMEMYLPQVSNQLLSLIESPETHFLVVSISLWACEKLIEYFLSDETLLKRLVNQITSRMQSPSKKVQESAVAALETLLNAGETDALEPYTGLFIATASYCISGYQLKNRLLLMEVVGLLCDKLGPVIQYNESFISQLLEPIGKVWASIPDNSPLLFSVFECMANICGVLGAVMSPDMIGIIFNRAMNQLKTYLVDLEADDAPEFVVTAADLISGLLDGIGAGLEPYVSPQKDVFMQMIIAMSRAEDHPNVRRSGFALCGDISKSFPLYLQAVLAPYCEAVLLNLSTVTENTYMVVSNLAWSVSNLLEYEVPSDAPTLSGSQALNDIYVAMAHALASTELTVDMRNMADNLALALGMILATDPAVVNRTNCHAAQFSRPFCEYVKNMKQELPQKTMALRGYLQSIIHRPQGVEGHLKLFVELSTSLRGEPNDIIKLMAQALQLFRSGFSGLWQQVLQQCRQQELTLLYQLYGIN